MKNLYKITDDLSVVCESFSNSRNWGHYAFAIYNGRSIADKKIIYQNRTWERYQFESVLACLLDILDKEKTVPLKDRYALAQRIKNSCLSFK